MKKLSIGTKNVSNRESWLENALKKVPKNSSILDAGAGELQYKKYCSHLKYVSQDFGQYDGTGDGIGLQTEKWDQSKLDIICDIIEMPLEDESFDAIMCIEVLEHLPNPILALKEMARVVKKNGQLIITAPFCSFTHFAPHHYSTGFSRYFYEYHLKELGFEIIETTANGNYFEYLAQEIRRLNSVSKLYTERKLSFFDKVCSYFLLMKIQKLESLDTSSQDFLNYGYHIIAQKK